jgi:hypothetical protein
MIVSNTLHFFNANLIGKVFSLSIFDIHNFQGGVAEITQVNYFQIMLISAYE